MLGRGKGPSSLPSAMVVTYGNFGATRRLQTHNYTEQMQQVLLGALILYKSKLIKWCITNASWMLDGHIKKQEKENFLSNFEKFYSTTTDSVIGVAR